METMKNLFVTFLEEHTSFNSSGVINGSKPSNLVGLESEYNHTSTTIDYFTNKIVLRK